MYLKKLYDSYGKVPKVQVLRAGRFQKFWPRLILKGLQEGWLEQTEQGFTIKGSKENIYYDTVHAPGAVVDGKVIKTYLCERRDQKEEKSIWQTLSTILQKVG